MDQEYDLKTLKNDRQVYVRSVQKADLPDELRTEVDGYDQIYAIHSEDGEQLALVKDRDLAFAVARTNDFTPVSVH